MTFEAVRDLFPGGRLTPRGEYECRCPAHRDRRASLGIRVGRQGGILVKCMAGCPTRDILAQVGLTLADLASPTAAPQANGHAPAGDTVYVYADEAGRPLFEVVRTQDKHFWQRLPGAGKGGIGTVRRVLFDLPHLLQAPEGARVYLVEGEKDVWRLQKLGLTATTNPGGAGKWHESYTAWLKEHLPGRAFILLPDNDDPGRGHMKAVFASLTDAGLPARLVALPDLPDKGDVSNWLDFGRSAEDLAQAVLPPPHPLLSTLLSREQLRSLPSPLWQIDELFQENSVLELYGGTNEGKTLVGVDIALSVVRGGHWCGREIKKPGAVVYVNADGGAGFSDRLRWWEAANGPEAIFDFWTYPEPLILHDPQAVRWLAAGVKELADPPVMMFFDTLSQCIPGANENQQEQMSLVISHLNRLKNEYGCAVVLLHHVGKDGLNRGSTVIPGAADTIIRCSQVAGGLIELRCDKQRGGKKFEPLYFELRIHGTDAGVYLVEAAGPGPQVRKDEREAQVLEVLQVHADWLTVKEIKDRLVGISEPTVRRYLKHLMEEGVVQEERRANPLGAAAHVYLSVPPITH